MNVRAVASSALIVDLSRLAATRCGPQTLMTLPQSLPAVRLGPARPPLRQMPALFKIVVHVRRILLHRRFAQTLLSLVLVQAGAEWRRASGRAVLRIHKSAE